MNERFIHFSFAAFQLHKYDLLIYRRYGKSVAFLTNVFQLRGILNYIGLL